MKGVRKEGGSAATRRGRGSSRVAAGAEAILYRKGGFLVKERVPKRYRHPLLDEELRRSRTRREARILRKAPVPRPRIVESDDESVIVMEFIKGVVVKQLLDDEPRLARRIGELVAGLHDAGIIHGDLTTSNMILREGEILLIDFGLSFHSQSAEDKAVDLHLFRQALNSKHYAIAERAFKEFLSGYAASPASPSVVQRLVVVEQRGRNKGRA